MLLSYNFIQLSHVKTHSFAQQPVWSTDGTDWIANRYYIDVSAVYNPSATSYLPGLSPIASAGQAPATTAAALKHFLGEPRKQLLYQDEAGHVVISSPPSGNTRDAIDGPKPVHVNVQEILGQKTWLVRFAIETYLCDCPGAGPGALLSNRWSNSHQIGEDQMTTIITAGESRFAMSALENLGQTADYFRNVVVPPSPLGFRRLALNVMVNTIGDRLVWQSVDRQQYYALGDSGSSLFPGVLRFEGSFTQQSISGSDSLVPTGRIMNAATIAVQGKPAASRAELLIFAVRMGISRIWPAGVPAAPGADGFITRVAAKEDLHQPAVSVHIEANMPAAQTEGVGLGGLRADKFLADGVRYQFDNPLLSAAGLCPDLGSDNNTRTPSYVGQAFAAAIQDPCTAPSPVEGPPGPGGTGSSYQLSPPYSIVATVGTSVGLDTADTLWSDDNTSSLYSEYRIDNVYKTDSGLYVAPIAGPVSGSTQYGHTNDKGEWVPDSPSTPTVEVMRLGLPMTTMASEWSVERAGSPPVIPDPNPTDDTFVLLNKVVQQTSVAVAADGQTKLYRTNGRYEYVMKRPVYNECMRMFPVTPNTFLRADEEYIAEIRQFLFMGDGTDEANDTPPPDWSGGLLQGGGGNDGISGNF